MGVPSRHGDPREDNGEALPHPRQEPTPAPRRPAPATLPVPSQPQGGSPESGTAECAVSTLKHSFLRNHTFHSVVHLSRQAGAQRGTCMASNELGK